VRKDTDFLIALTHWECIGGGNLKEVAEAKEREEQGQEQELEEKKDTDKAPSNIIETISQSLGIDEAYLYPITNYVGIRHAYTHTDEVSWRKPQLEEPVLHLVDSAMRKIDQSQLFIRRLVEERVVYVPNYHLQIIGARYFAKNQRHLGKEVGDLIQAKLAKVVANERDAEQRQKMNLGISFSVSNAELGGDPARGKTKQLEVTYVYKFEKKQVTFEEGECLNLP